ncbi:unnamed protein product [Miscanthus lutarioriparius]|uniref:Uncharacterized protein n=1 Tax=Miscanthus lutarioriparius TaxID=422564 RepID=A0A811NF18_9POAL|nr:unnamed protein product [Miscanthus lutarioriparius]
MAEDKVGGSSSAGCPGTPRSARSSAPSASTARSSRLSEGIRYYVVVCIKGHLNLMSYNFNLIAADDSQRLQSLPFLYVRKLAKLQEKKFTNQLSSLNQTPVFAMLVLKITAASFRSQKRIVTGLVNELHRSKHGCQCWTELVAKFGCIILLDQFDKAEKPFVLSVARQQWNSDDGYGYGGGGGGGYSSLVLEVDIVSGDGSGRSGRYSPASRYGGGTGGRGDRFGGSDRFARYDDDRYDGGRYVDSKDTYYGAGRDRYASDRYAPAADRYSGDRYSGADHYASSGFARERSYERDVGRSNGGYYRDDPRGTGGYGRGGSRQCGWQRRRWRWPARFGGSYQIGLLHMTAPSREGSSCLR